MDFDSIVSDFKNAVPPCDFWSLRIVQENNESLCVRENIVQPPQFDQSLGAHITIMHQGGMAYAATSQLNREGFKHAIQQALSWAKLDAKHGLINSRELARPQQSGSYQSPVQIPWASTGLQDKLELLQNINQDLKISSQIIDWQSLLNYRKVHTRLISSDDICIEQQFHYVFPGVLAVANNGHETQSRSGGGWGTARQGGLEQLTSMNFPAATQQVAEEAIALLNAPECPSDNMSVLLLPSQMMLQIHESIGHPLEVDRILGDERNYAGTSFVTMDMCGHYQYGSELLNVTYDPQHKQEMASYAFDDDGTPAERSYIIRQGRLERLLGGATSQTRSNMPGVANARASDWNRPTIDRMANLNLEPGSSSMQDLISNIENGILMDSNSSWSIDDSRNKFQFGCELGKIIKDGEVKGLVKNPNYRGISANFWRNLSAVGNASTFEIWGTPYCGKGEPNQMVHVGHASPACVFNNVEVFGGD